MQTTSTLLAAQVASAALLVGCDRTDPRAATYGRDAGRALDNELQVRPRN